VSTRHKRVLIAGGAVAATVAVLLALSWPGGVETYAGARASAPAWTAPCWTRAARRDRKLLAPCARLRGRVLWVRREGIGARSKAEMIVAGHLGLVVSKMAPYTDRRVPAVGHYVTIVGPLVRSRAGLREVQFFAQN
jgi:hypothetical protein